MINFICGRSGVGKSDLLMKRLREAADSATSVILIVPEQEAVTYERRCATELSPVSGTNVEVVSFTRLSDRVFREYGGFVHGCATKKAKHFLMWAALDSVRGALSYYSPTGTERLVESMLRTVKELHTYRVTPAMLEQVSTELREGDRAEVTLSKKLSDISLILAAYDALLAHSFSDSDSIPEKAAALISDRGFFCNRAVFVDSFYTLSPVQREILRYAMKDAREFCMTFACGEADGGEPHLKNIRRHFDKMKAIADSLAREVSVTSLTEPVRFAMPSLAVLERDIWDFTKKGSSVSCDGITVISTSDRYSEATAAASAVRRLVYEGAGYSDIAIIARNASALEGITDTVLTERGIPHYSARRQRLSSSPAAALVSASLRVAAYGWRSEDVTAVMKTGLAPVDKDESDAFENYINTWRIRGRRVFCDEGDFGMSPGGYASSSPERDIEILERVNSAKKRLCPPLASFCDIFEGGKASAAVCAEALYSLLTEYGVPERIAELSKRLRELDRPGEAAECLRMWDALMEVLDALATTIPDAAGDAETFQTIITRIISATDVGTIPTGVDEVQFGSADMIRTDRLRHAIVIGAVDGEFPGRAPADGILSDTDRVILEGCGIELADGSDAVSAREMFLFYKALCSASHSLTLILPETSGRDRCEPSVGAVRLMELFGISPVPFVESELSSFVWTKDDLIRLSTVKGEARSIAEAILPPSSLPELIDVTEGADGDRTVSAEVMKDIIGRELILSQSRIDIFVKCRFKYTADFTIGIEPLPGSVIGFSDTGTLVHAVLEDFFRECAEEQFPLSRERERELADIITERHTSALFDKGAKSGRQKFLLRKLKKSIRVFLRSLSAEFGQSAFAPWGFEQRMGYDDPASIPAEAFILPDGTRVRLRGVIDRIDVMRRDGVTYVRVVDYKTGPKEFSLADIYQGLNLQLLLYLFSVWKCPPGEFRDAITAGGDSIIPAGAMYFSARPGESTSPALVTGEDSVELAADSIKRTGIVLADPDIIRAMDRDISGRYAPVKKDRSGEPVLERNTATVERFGQLYLDISDSLTAISTEITRGSATAKPNVEGENSPCNYCSYRPFCRRR